MRMRNRPPYRDRRRRPDARQRLVQPRFITPQGDGLAAGTGARSAATAESALSPSTRLAGKVRLHFQFGRQFSSSDEAGTMPASLPPTTVVTSQALPLFPRAFGLDVDGDGNSEAIAPAGERAEGNADKPGESSAKTGQTPASNAAVPAPAAPAEMSVALRVAPKTDPVATRIESIPSARLEQTPAATPDPAPRPASSNPWTAAATAASVETEGLAKPPSEPPQPVASIDAPAEPRPKAAPSLRDVSIEIQQSGQERVEVRLLQRSGELQIAVRATDTDLSHAIRQDLPQLAHRIEQEGHRVEAWRPGGMQASGAVEPRAAAPEFARQDPDSQQRWSQPDRDQHHGRKNVPQWVDDLDGPSRENQEIAMASAINPITSSATSNTAASAANAAASKSHLRRRSCNCWSLKSRTRIRSIPPTACSSSRSWPSSANSSR